MTDHQTVPTMFVSQVAFWRNRTGAEQRILSLLNYIAGQGNRVETLYCGKLTETDVRQIAEHELTVHAAFDDPVPTNWIEKAVWELRCTANLVLERLSLRKSLEDRLSTNRGLQQFRSPAFGRFFRRHAIKMNPRLVVVEYISLGWLTKYLPASVSENCVLAIDTHDIMHRRCEQFSKEGKQHWIDVNEADEIAALSEFDLILAIQEEERDALQRMLPESNVVTVMHAVDVCPVPCREDSQVIAFGYFGSSNASNQEAINSFLERVWPKLLSQLGGTAELLIAGGICQELTEGKIENGRLLGFIEQPHSFYERVDVVINPVRFGTGLKIKNLEALGFGAALVTSTEGATGLPKSKHAAFLIADEPDALAETLCRLAGDAAKRKQLRTEAIAYAKTHLSADQVYQPMMHRVEELLP